MGASGWSYFVPYQDNIEQALQELRQEVFQRGAYYKPAEFHRRLYEGSIGQHMPPQDRQAYRAEIEHMESQSKPTTIAALLAANREEGTHSIIDIEQIAAEPDFAVAAPLASDTLHQLFGTQHPTHEMVTRKAGEIFSLRRRWQGTYIVVYQDNQPTELYFTGYSGD